MPYRQPELIPKESSFPGIAQGFPADGASGEVDVFIVHGMCNHDAKWAKETFEELSVALGLRITSTVPEFLLSGAELYRATLSDGKRTANLVAFVWTPLTADAKRSLCFDVTKDHDRNKACTEAEAISKQKRSSLNGKLKNQLLDECLADAIIYSGNDRGRAIRDAAKEALVKGIPVRLRAPAQGGEETPLYMISDSLGSKILLDAIEELTPLSNDFVKKTVGRMKAVYLRANQIPLLNLIDWNQTSEPKPFEPIAQSIRELKATQPFRHPAGSRLPIIAFSDPNDLLSYALHDAAYENDALLFVDVLVSNEWTYFGYVERPDTAHTSYPKNRCVIAAIANGSTGLKKACH